MSRSINFAIALALLALAALQLNDPDPLFWVSLYAVAALPPALAIAGGKPSAIFWLAVGFSLAGVAASLGGGLDYLQHWREVSLAGPMDGDRPYIESAREAIGAFIALALLCLHQRISSTTSA
jgi:hypothetical protein